jgi:chaperone modulatory protein CbpM
MSKRPLTVIDILDDDFEFSLVDLCRCCSVKAETIIEMVDEGMLSPYGLTPADWRFGGTSLRKVEITLNLQRDLGINLQGAALALDLLEEIEVLRARIRNLGY